MRSRKLIVLEKAMNEWNCEADKRLDAFLSGNMESYDKFKASEKHLRLQAISKVEDIIGVEDDETLIAFKEIFGL